MKERGKPPRISTRILALIGAVVISSTGMAAFSSMTGNKAQLAELGDVDRCRASCASTRLDRQLQFLTINAPVSWSRRCPLNEGFVQVTMRNLDRLRLTAGHGGDAPYRLQRHATGHVVLLDPETGTKISLNAFGPTNAQAFAQLLQEGKS
jgi:putative photosynthetic complex assembly protein